MNDISEQRPDFFEGEYLSASDLDQLIIYLRDQGARHLLGGHAWGIVSGLELVEQTSPTGGLDLYLLPGHAVDGYGRAVVVINPLRLSPNDFNGQPTGPVQVWLRYDQGSTRATRPGFEVCCTGDSYTRVAESYVLEVGVRSTLEQQAGISVAGEAVADARTASRVFDDNGPVIPDGSVSYQDLPLADESNKWLIPLGLVGWQNGTPGQLLPLSEDQRLFSRRLRRYQGVVAENVYASDGVIRLRKRTLELPVGPPVDQDLIDSACATQELSDPSHDKDLKLCDGKPTPNELVWVEGRLRVTDDARILGGRLEMRDPMGTDYLPSGEPGSVPLFLQRTDRDENADLEIVIGKAEKGNNRLLIKQADLPVADTPDCGNVSFTETTKVAVLDNGNVGIGTDDPDQLLEIQSAENAPYIHLQNTAAPSELFVGAGEFGGVLAVTDTNDLRIRTGGVSDPEDDETTRMIVNAEGRVGIGTTEPHDKRVLTLEDDGASYMIARIKSDPLDPNAEAHEILVGANGDGALVTSNVEGDDLVLGSDENQPVMWIKANGRVGINTDNPAHDLGVNGSSKAEIAVRASSGNHRLVLGADGDGVNVGSNTDDDLHFKTNDVTQMTLTTQGFLGIGTTNPDVHLEVRGSIKLGSGGQYHAPGAIGRWRIVAGNVAANGDVALGGGFVCVHTPGSNSYAVVYDTPFVNAPVVTVTGTNANAIAVWQWPVVLISSTTGFTVAFMNRDPLPVLEEKFSFIVFGER
jgi:hypothetical protein